MSMVCIYAHGDNSGTSQHCCLLCVMHNSVGSALLVPTVDGHTRASMRGTGNSTVPTLFLLYIARKGTAGGFVSKKIGIIWFNITGLCIVFTWGTL